MRMNLPPDVRLKTANIHALPEEAHAWLSDEERARAATYSHPERCASFVAGRWAVRALLHEILGIPPREIALLVHPDGWIYAPDAPNWAVSISHTAHLAAAGVAPSRIGVDLERTSRRMSPALHRYLFHPNDPQPALEEQRMALWTIKEAVLKAMHTGLRVRPNTLRVEGTPDVGDVCVHTSQGEKWRVQTTRLDDVYLSVAVPEESVLHR